nr:uncharacterized protein LOC123569732 [Macaca fascicularis]
MKSAIPNCPSSLQVKCLLALGFLFRKMNLCLPPPDLGCSCCLQRRRGRCSVCPCLLRGRAGTLLPMLLRHLAAPLPGQRRVPHTHSLRPVGPAPRSRATHLAAPARGRAPRAPVQPGWAQTADLTGGGCAPPRPSHPSEAQRASECSRVLARGSLAGSIPPCPLPSGHRDSGFHSRDLWTSSVPVWRETDPGESVCRGSKKPAGREGCCPGRVVAALSGSRNITTLLQPSTSFFFFFFPFETESRSVAQASRASYLAWDAGDLLKRCHFPVSNYNPALQRLAKWFKNSLYLKKLS